MKFTTFDQRNYPTVSPTVGYSEWADTYENSVPDLLDIGILRRIKSVCWTDARECLDFACGTGRIGVWLRAVGVSTIDGVDITPEMLAKARARNIYRELRLGGVDSTGITSQLFDLSVMSLADEHLPELGPVYSEAARLSTREAKFIVVGMHPFFFMNGMPTHFKDKSGSSKAIETHIHLASDHFTAANDSGWKLKEFLEGVIDDSWVEAKPKWEKFRNYPVNYAYVWTR